MRAQRVAVKILDKRKLKRKRVGRFSNAQGVQREVAVWKKLDHKHCVKLFEVIDDEENGNIFLVSELVQGGSMVPDGARNILLCTRHDSTFGSCCWCSVSAPSWNCSP